MRIHKVSPEEIDQLKALGFGGMGVNQLVRFRIHKVTPEYIRSMREVGFTAVSEDQLVQDAHSQGRRAVRPRTRATTASTVQTPGDAVDLAIHGPRWKRKY